MNNTKTASDTKHFYDSSKSTQVRLIRWSDDSSDNLQYGLCRVYCIEDSSLVHDDNNITGWNTDILSDKMYGDVSTMRDEVDSMNEAFHMNPINAWEYPEITFGLNEEGDDPEKYVYWYTLTPYTPVQ